MLDRRFLLVSSLLVLSVCVPLPPATKTPPTTKEQSAKTASDDSMYWLSAYLGFNAGCAFSSFLFFVGYKIRGCFKRWRIRTATPINAVDIEYWKLRAKFHEHQDRLRTSATTLDPLRMLRNTPDRWAKYLELLRDIKPDWEKCDQFFLEDTYQTPDSEPSHDQSADLPPDGTWCNKSTVHFGEERAILDSFAEKVNEFRVLTSIPLNREELWRVASGGKL